MEENKLESGFEIQNILLLESSFSRINNVIFDRQVKNNVNIETDVSINGNEVIVIEQVTVSQMFEETKQVSIQVKMVGIFEKKGDAAIDNLEDFGYINGAAILYPYIREHITNLSLKSGIGPIILSPINFTKNKKNN